MSRVYVFLFLISRTFRVPAKRKMNFSCDFRYPACCSALPADRTLVEVWEGNQELTVESECSSRNPPWIYYYNSDKEGCILNWRRLGSTWRVKWASCGCVFLAVSQSNLSRYRRTQSQFMSFHVCPEISGRYCAPELNVFFFILQRRRRIDRTMIGEPMNFKVSALFWCLILFSGVKFNKLFDWLELSYFCLFWF